MTAAPASNESGTSTTGNTTGTQVMATPGNATQLSGTDDDGGQPAMPRLANPAQQQNPNTNPEVSITAEFGGDVISGNSWDGVHIIGGASGNLVEGNDIGVTLGASSPLGNGASGVAILDGASDNTVGGVAGIVADSLAGAGDVISANGMYGVYISDSGTSDNVVEGSYIGTNSTGSQAFPNYDGVYITSDTSGNTIGGTAQGTGDVISGNTEDGVHIVYGATANVVEGDYIGVTSNGSAALGNGASGVAILAGAYANLIGGTAATFLGSLAGAGDVISGNGQFGVYMSDSTTQRQPGRGRLYRHRFDRLDAHTQLRRRVHHQ